MRKQRFRKALSKLGKKRNCRVLAGGARRCSCSRRRYRQQCLVGFGKLKKKKCPAAEFGSAGQIQEEEDTVLKLLNAANSVKSRNGSNKTEAASTECTNKHSVQHTTGIRDQETQCNLKKDLPIVLLLVLFN